MGGLRLGGPAAPAGSAARQRCLREALVLAYVWASTMLFNCVTKLVYGVRPEAERLDSSGMDHSETLPGVESIVNILIN